VPFCFAVMSSFAPVEHGNQICWETYLVASMA
jgi:hypothetical protein